MILDDFFNDKIGNINKENSLEYLFYDELDYLFIPDKVANTKVHYSISIIASYEISNFNNETHKANFNINREFNNQNNKSNFEIDRIFQNKNNYSFYKLGLLQPPPKRIVLKGFDD